MTATGAGEAAAVVLVLCRRQRACRRICRRITAGSRQGDDRQRLRVRRASRLIAGLVSSCSAPLLRHAAALQHWRSFFFCVEGFQKIARGLLALSLMPSARL